MSTGSASMLSELSAGRLSGYSGFAFRFPEKLQIVKPMEGKCVCVRLCVCPGVKENIPVNNAFE